jgi:N-acetylglucosaminyldiphosphoundecaprenol N-acetyl-beta-D-mannosaminyltransferase
MPKAAFNDRTTQPESASGPAGQVDALIRALPQAEMLGVNVRAATGSDLLHLIGLTIQGDERALLLNVNAHALNLAYEMPWLKDFFNRARLVFPDGSGALLAGRLMGRPFRQRVTYADWFIRLAEYCATNGFSLFFLGGRPGVAEEAKAVLQKPYPGLQIAGTYHGYFEKQTGNAENEAVLREIQGAAPDILVVGFGMPLQERWLLENWEILPCHIGLTGGAVFDYISGELRRPPPLLRDHGLEWLGRLIIEPRRLWRRYLLGVPKFMWRLCRQLLYLHVQPEAHGR